MTSLIKKLLSRNLFSSRLSFRTTWLSNFIFISLFTSLFAYSNNSRAGFDKGNGGDGFDCTEPLNAFFFAEEIEALPKWGIKTLTPELLTEKMAPFDALQNLHNLFPILTEMVREDLLWVKTQLKIINNADLVDLDDDLLAWIPNNCTLVQVALQTQTHVFIVQSYWEKMTPIQQDMLLTHEAIYRSLDRLATEQNLRIHNSIGVRLINAFIWQQNESIDYTPMSPSRLRQALSNLRLPTLN